MLTITRYLTNELLWEEITSRIRSADRVHAAIAYFGTGGAKRLRLRPGDRLVVNLGVRAVKEGVSDPTEIEKLLRKGVMVFTRTNMHAKVIVADRVVVASSANVSKRSQERLEEAGMLTSDPVAVDRALEFINRLALVPVTYKYIRQVKPLFRKEMMFKSDKSSSEKETRTRHASLWMIALKEATIPECEKVRYEQGERRAIGLIKDHEQFTNDSFHWPRKPRFADEFQPNDVIIQAVTYEDGSILIYPPAYYLSLDVYVRNPELGKQRYVFHLQVRHRQETLTWKEFTSRAKRWLPAGKLRIPRTLPVRDQDVADNLQRIWTPRGRVART